MRFLVPILFLAATSVHHGKFYNAVYLALEDKDLTCVKKLFAEESWSKTGKKLAEQLKKSAFAFNLSEGTASKSPPCPFPFTDRTYAQVPPQFHV